MLDPSNAGGWLVFLPSIWIILSYYVYALIHMRRVLRTIDIIVGGLIVRYIFDSVITYPIVIHYIINGYAYNYSDCRSVIWFNQCGYWFSLGLVTALVIDVTIRMQRLTGNNLASKLIKVPTKFKLLGLAVWWLVSAIIAGVLPAHQWTSTFYRYEVRASCTYLPFMQNSGYAIFVVVMTAIFLFFCLFMGIECVIRLNQVHLLAVMKQTQTTSEGLQYQRRRTKRLIHSMRVTLVVTIVVWLGSHFTAIVINLQGLVKSTWQWEPLVLAHFWMYLFELILLPVLLIATATRYRHPLYVLYHWATGLQRPDKVCALEDNDRRMKTAGKPVAEETIVNRNYATMASVPTISVYEEINSGNKAVPVRQHNSQQTVSVELHPAYQAEQPSSILKRISSEVEEPHIVEERVRNKKTPPQFWEGTSEVQPRASNLIFNSQLKGANTGFEDKYETSPVLEEICLEEKVGKEQSVLHNSSHYNNAFLDENNLRGDEEVREASIMIEDDFWHSRGDSDVEDWESRYPNMDNGYNSFRDLEMMSNARTNEGGHGRGKSRGSLNNSFWLSENEID